MKKGSTIIKEEAEDWNTSTVKLNDIDSDRYDQCREQAKCYDDFVNWSARLDEKGSDINKFMVECHPADLNIPSDKRRRGYEMEILLMTNFRSFIFAIDSDTEIRGYDCLRQGFLLRRSNYIAAAQKYEDAGGDIMHSKDLDSLKGKEMSDFIWWSVASDPDRGYCYCVGMFEGDSRPSLYARSTFKRKWGKIVDTQINEIRVAFGQAPIAKGKGCQKLLKLH